MRSGADVQERGEEEVLKKLPRGKEREADVWRMCPFTRHLKKGRGLS